MQSQVVGLYRHHRDIMALSNDIVKCMVCCKEVSERQQALEVRRLQAMGASPLWHCADHLMTNMLRDGAVTL